MSQKTTPTSKMEIDGEAIRELAALMEETGLTEIEVSEGDRRVRVGRHHHGSVHAAPVSYQHADTASQPSVAKPTDAGVNRGTVTSPMVGTAYLRPDPSSPPFIKAGDTVNAGDTLLIIEAMKVMNPIKAAKGGTITRIIVSDAQPVEFGEALVVIE